MSDRLRPPSKLVISRRALIGGFIGGALNAALPKPAEAQFFVDQLKMPVGERERIQIDNAPIIELYPPSSRNYNLTIVKGDRLWGTLIASRDANLTTTLSIVLVYPDTSALNLEYGLIAARHEYAHGFDETNYNLPARYVGSLYDPIIRSPYEDRWEKLRPLTEYTHYRNRAPGIVIGHPWDNWKEVFASGTTVASKFPNELISYLEQNRQFAPSVANTVLRVIAAYRKYAYEPISIQDLLFDQKFILELQRIGRGQTVLIPQPLFKP